MKRASTAEFEISRKGGSQPPELDHLVVEEPLEIRVQPAAETVASTLAITMRTPGEDHELTAGLLFGEGVVASNADIAAIEVDVETDEEGGAVTVKLAAGVDFDPERLSRALLTASSCGVCGRATLDLLWQSGTRPFARRLEPRPSVLAELPDRMRGHQPVFSKTGGCHAAALFDTAGDLRLIREDVGRHNAVDKIVGSLLLDNSLPAGDTILAVSGRASYELVQKALVAGIPCLAAIGAPSSLAAELAAEFRMTLVGFVGREGGNVYG